MTGFLLWFALLAALVGVTLLLYRRPPVVTLERHLPGSVFADGQFRLDLRVRVRSRLPVRVFLDDSPPRTLVPDAIVDFGGLLWGDTTHDVTSRVTANRRGVYTWAPPTLRWADPFGLRWRSVTLDAPATSIEVYPGTHGLVLPDLLRPLLSEGALSRTIGLEDPISLRSWASRCCSTGGRRS
ncbi:hypothetical protein [Deinococcus pimensis]|uniref:hypothetical protein n=1 Tax=Deinococcus pimensis TaxID=309888 RepID=UPI0004B5C0E6|nr:hypothetical protein [Deinococcus pimensis]